MGSILQCLYETLFGLLLYPSKVHSIDACNSSLPWILPSDEFAIADGDVAKPMIVLFYVVQMYLWGVLVSILWRRVFVGRGIVGTLLNIDPLVVNKLVSLSELSRL